MQNMSSLEILAPHFTQESVFDFAFFLDLAVLLVAFFFGLGVLAGFLVELVTIDLGLLLTLGINLYHVLNGTDVSLLNKFNSANSI